MPGLWQERQNATMAIGKQTSIYGAHRSIDPPGSLPQLAWKLDTSLPIMDSELLINVHTLNLNAASFAQLVKETEGDPIQIIRKICNIVSTRGKMHNPITGSGGTLLGTVAKVGKQHPGRGSLQPGEQICTLVSLTLTPLVIKSVKSIDVHTGQLDIEGHAILFASGIYARVPKTMAPKLFLSVFGEAGSSYQSYLLCKTGQCVMVLGSVEKVGVLSLFALREKLGNTGCLIAVIDQETNRRPIEDLGVADKIICENVADVLAASAHLAEHLNGWEVDLTIDCLSLPGSEMLSVLVTRSGGTVYYANPATRYSAAGLGAEGIGKELTLLFYQGYLRGHVDFCVDLVNKYPALSEHLAQRYHNRNYVKVNKNRLSLHHAPEVFKKQPNASDIVIHSQAMNDILRTVKRISSYNTTVLITGESGTGKEVVAKILYQSSSRNTQPYLKVNCAAIPDNLIEAELFGYAPGAFTGALKEGKPGYFEIANNGTLFLDEIGEMSLANQTKLLRVIQEKEIIRVGGKNTIPVDVRIIAATNRDIKAMVNQGTFREDLYYRINVVNLHIPPLRERRESIPPMVETHLQKFNVQFNTKKYLHRDAMALLANYDWPGNIRELENMIQRLILCSDEQEITAKEVRQLICVGTYGCPSAAGSPPQPARPAAEEPPPRAAAAANLYEPTPTPVPLSERELYEQAVGQHRSTRAIAAALAKLLGRPIATAKEAREMLNL